MSINSEDRPWPQTLDHEGVDWPPEEQRVLVPFREAVNRSEAGFLGAGVTFGTDGSLYLLHAVDDDETTTPTDIREQVELKRDIQDRFGIPVTHQTGEFSQSLLDSFVRSHSITTTIVDHEEESFFPRGRAEETVPRDCHTVVGTGMEAFESPSSILVPVARGPHSGLATRIAESVARAYDCWMELFHVIPEDAPAEAERDADELIDAYQYRLSDDIDVDPHVLRAPDPAEAIIEHSGYHSVTVLGAPEKGKLRRFLFGSTTDEVTRNSDSRPILTAHRNSADSFVSRWF